MELWDVYDEHRNLVGRTHERGVPMQEGNYHLVVHVWIQGADGRYLISRRTPNKTYPGQWECTGGSAITGDTSLMAALREVKEELGLDLDLIYGSLILSKTRDNEHEDVWLFRQDVDIGDVVFQQDETNGARWATPDDIRQMMASGEFVPVYDYLEWLFKEKAPVQRIVTIPDESGEPPQFSVVACMHSGKWVFVRQAKRDTFELPGGHIEPGERPEQAARRELYEESGAVDYDLWPLCPYSVTRSELTTRGMLFFAYARQFEAVPEDFEMAERVFLSDLPEKMTYPDIQPKLLQFAEAWVAQHVTRVYFIRHAESDTSVREDRVRPLTQAGLMAANELVDKLGGIGFDAIYASPYLRAMQTVAPLASALGLPVTEVFDLRERRVAGDWIPQADFDDFSRREWADFGYKLSDGESLQEVQQRNIQALRAILGECRNKTVAIGTHGCALSTILNHFDPSFGHDAYRALLPKLPCVYRLTFIDDVCVEVQEQ